MIKSSRKSLPVQLSSENRAMKGYLSRPHLSRFSLTCDYFRSHVKFNMVKTTAMEQERAWEREWIYIYVYEFIFVSVYVPVYPHTHVKFNFSRTYIESKKLAYHHWTYLYT